MALSSGYFAAVAALNPTVFYKMNDTTGTAGVDSMGTINGTYVEVSAPGYTLNQTSIIPGEPDEPCVQLQSTNDSGTGGRLGVSDVPSFGHSPAANEFTALMTYQPTTGFAAASRDLMGKLDEWQLWVLTSGKLLLYVNPAWVNFTGTTTLVAGTAYHIVVRQGGGNIQMFINGASDGSKGKSNNLLDIPLELRWGGGSNPGSGRFGVGYIQGAAYWPGSYLSDANITALHTLWATVPEEPPPEPEPGLGRATRDPKSGLWVPKTPYFTRRWRG